VVYAEFFGLPQTSEEVLRDGDEDAALGTIAGFAELGVIAHRSRRPSLDLEDRVHLYETPKEFERILDTVVGRKQRSGRSQSQNRKAGTIDFGPLLNRKLQDFVGRNWLTRRSRCVPSGARSQLHCRSQPTGPRENFFCRLIGPSVRLDSSFRLEAHDVVGFDQFLQKPALSARSSAWLSPRRAGRVRIQAVLGENASERKYNARTDRRQNHTCWPAGSVPTILAPFHRGWRATMNSAGG
jgi:hypothetical protein